MSDDPKMTKEEAIRKWNNMTLSEKIKFNDFLGKLYRGELMMVHVNVDDNEVIQNIVLEPKDKPSQPTAPFAKHFKQG